MSENLIARLDRISSEVLHGTTRIETLGENYYTFEVTDAQGMKSALPHIWIDPEESDGQIQTKLARAFQEALQPELGRDDSSVPNLRTEGRLS